MMTETTKVKFFLTGLFVAGLVLSIYMLNTLVIHSDNLQMMDKAVRYMTTGEFIHFGNASTKVGSIPGSLTTFLSAVPMKLWPTPYAAMAVIILFHIGSLFFLAKSQSLIKPESSLLVLLVFYWLNPWRVEQAELYNPAYLFLFSTVHLYSSLKMKESNFWWSFINVLSIGLCMQIHFAFIILALTSFFLWLQRQLKVNWKGVFAGIFFIVLSLVPYLIQKQSSLENLQDVDLTRSDAFLGRNFVLVYPVLKAILYFFRMGSLYLGRHIFSEINFLWIQQNELRAVISTAFHALKWLFAAVTLYVSFRIVGGFLRAQFKHIKQIFSFKRTCEVSNEKRFYNYFFVMFISVIIASGLSPVEFNHWHLVLCMPIIVLFLTLSLETFLSKKTLVAIATVFVVWNLLAAMGSRSHSYKNNYERDFFRHYETLLNTVQD